MQPIGLFSLVFSIISTSIMLIALHPHQPPNGQTVFLLISVITIVAMQLIGILPAVFLTASLASVLKNEKYSTLITTVKYIVLFLTTLLVAYFSMIGVISFFHK